MACMPQPEFYLIMKALEEVRLLLRKITRGLARILAGIDKKLYLGNLDAKRDWGYAKDFVEAMWLILQQENPDDYVIATGETWSVRDFLDKAFGVMKLDWKDYVEFDPRYLRPTEVDLLIGDPSKAEKQFGWKRKTSFEELVKFMVKSDLDIIKFLMIFNNMYSTSVKKEDFHIDTISFFEHKNVLVTGGSGFIGSHVVEQLLLLKANPIIISRNKSPKYLKNLKGIKTLIGDLNDKTFVSNCINQSHVVMHLAASVAGIEYNKKHPATIFKDNMEMFMNTIHAAALKVII